jgi:hypothetical protein
VLLTVLNEFCYIIFASIAGKWVDVRIAVCRNQFFFRCAAKALLSDAHMSVKLMRYLRETVYLYELVCFFADASGGIFLRWCTGLLKNISRLEKDSELRKNTRLLLQNHVKVSLMPL